MMENEGRQFEITEDREYRNVRYVIVRYAGLYEGKPFFNGYIKICDDEEEVGRKILEYFGKVQDKTFALVNRDIETVDLTFSGVPDQSSGLGQGYWIGFTTNRENVVSTLENTEKLCKDLIDEFKAKKVFNYLKNREQSVERINP